MSSRRKDGKKRKKGLIQSLLYADVAELADAQVSGSCGNPVQVQILSSAPKLGKNVQKGIVFALIFLLFKGIFRGFGD